MNDIVKLNDARKITMAAARDAELPAHGDYIIRDTEYRTLGFGLRVYATGVKSWIVQKKVAGKPKRVVLGQFPGVTRDMALKLAQAAQIEFIQGLDPNRERKKRVEAQEKEAEISRLTMGVAFAEYQTASALGSKPRTIADREAAKRRLETGDLWKKPLVEVTGEDVVAEYRRLVAAGKSGTNGGKTQAGATMRWVRAAFHHAADTRNWALATPFRTLSKAHKGWQTAPARNRIVANVEGQLKSWWSAVDALRLKTGFQQLDSGTIADFLQLALLLGGRRTELLSLPWCNVDLKHRVVTFTDTKNSSTHVVPLPRHAQAILEHRQALCEKNETWVFPSSRPRKDGTFWHLQEPKKTIAAVAIAAQVPFAAHDLRRTFASLLNEMKVSLAAIEKALNHAATTTATRHYIVTRLEPTRALYQALEDQILAEAGVADTTKASKRNKKAIA